MFNAGGDRNNYTKKALIDEIRRFLPAMAVDFQAGGADRRNYRVSFKKIRERLGFEPRYDVPHGIAEILKALKFGLFKDVDEQRNFYGNYEIRYPSTAGAQR